MAKRTKSRSWSEKTEVKSFVLSVVFHCLVLCLLCFIIIKTEHSKNIRLSISFDKDPNGSFDTEFELVNLPDFKEIASGNEDIIHIPAPAVDDVVPEPLEPVIKETTSNDNITIVESTQEKVSTDVIQKPIVDNDNLDIFGLPKNNSTQSVGSSLSSNEKSHSTSGGGSGVEDKFVFRLSQKNAQTGDVQVSILWESVDDIDLWVEFVPFGGTSRHLINWMKPYDQLTGGMLDVDCNVSPTTNKPVENIFWQYNQAPFGTYNVYVHYFHQWTNKKNIPVQIRIVHDGVIEYRKSLVSSGSPPMRVYSFNRKIKKPDPTSQ